ncbi:MAG: T9SS type A sorting domain-containing protein [Chitinophagaceae bacterium]|nr:T9SS type A sorting domain-containing protein [Chitinophagaceae bacterium]
MTIKTKYKLIAFSMLVLSLAFTKPLFPQNCSNDSTGLIAITDLGSNLYQGYQGGLYFGSNIKPLQHSINLNNAIADISPLNNLGNKDSITGKIVLLSIGASNPKTEFESFKNMADTFNLINPFLEIVNGCKGGKGLQKIVDSTDNYWTYVENQLSTNNVSRHQVQIIWLEEENTQSNNTSFPAAPEELMDEFKELFKTLLHYYPNLQICYLTARGYAGYLDNSNNVGNGLKQPRDYFNGWAMKWLIENQISGDSSLSFVGANKKAPVLDWSAYLWADGKNQRNDGFRWNCPTDVKPNDGLHWSATGNSKAGNAIFERFITDNEAKKWFLKNQTTTTIEVLNKDSIIIYPNPFADIIHIKNIGLQKYQLTILNSLGQTIKHWQVNNDNPVINLLELKAGIYFLRIDNQKNAITMKIIKTQ